MNATVFLPRLSAWFATACAFLLCLGGPAPAGAQNPRPDQKKKPAPEFKWVNPLPDSAKDIPGLKHGTFYSESNRTDAGYLILLPDGYDDPANASVHYPVVYYLHGGRPGSELKGVSVAREIVRVTREYKLPRMIYVFNNGGAVSHYNFPEKNSFGETALIMELIPHIDTKYRTIDDRSGRGLEGFSQGGRATGRLMFKYPEMFFSVAPMGGGHQHEKRISETQGHESESMIFSLWETNSYDTAREYAARKEEAPKLSILVAFGTEDFNYEANLDWMKHLASLGIPFNKRIVEGVPHSATGIYQAIGKDVIRFHAVNFGLLEGEARPVAP